MPDGGIGEAALISAIIGGGASVAGGAIAAHSAKGAADTQAQSARDALAFEKEQYARSQQNLAPFMNLGASALPQLTSLAGRRTPNLGLPGNVYNPSANAPPAAANGGGTVMMQAPDGSRRAVRLERVAEAQAQGARRI